MTLKDILESGYGIDFSTLNFETKKGVDTCTKEEIIESLSKDEIIIDGNFVKDLNIYSDKPNGFVELYI